MDIGVGLYVRNSFEAVELYTAAFGLKLGYHVLNKGGGFYHSELLKEDKEILSVVESDAEVSSNNPVQLGITFSTKEELQQAFELLKKEGKVNMDVGPLPWSPCAAEVTDKFGVNWYLTVEQHRPPEDFEPEH